jgi:hypothetical protein
MDGIFSLLKYSIFKKCHSLEWQKNNNRRLITMEYVWEITDVSNNGKRFAVEMEINDPNFKTEDKNNEPYDGPTFMYIEKKDVLKLYDEFNVCDSFELIGKQFKSQSLIATTAMKNFLNTLEE